MLMRIKIKEPEPYENTCNFKLLSNVFWDIKKYLEKLNKILDESEVKHCNDVLDRNC